MEATRNDQPTDREAADRAMSRYACGEQAAFDTVYAYMAPRLYTFLLRRCRNPATAEDLVQQTFLRMHRARASFTPGGRLAPWAFTIANNVLIDGARANGRSIQEISLSREDIAAPARTDETVHARQLLGMLQRELGRLPAGQRSAFELVRGRGLSLIEAASELGVSVVAVKLRLHRAGLALEAALA